VAAAIERGELSGDEVNALLAIRPRSLPQRAGARGGRLA